MSGTSENGIIRIGRKGIKQFAFGEGEAFSVDVVTAWQQWLIIDEGFRPPEYDESGNSVEDRSVPNENAPAYYKAAQDFVADLAGGTTNDKGEITQITPAEALEFLARLREQWSELVVFFRPKLPAERVSPGSSEGPSVEVLFSEEGKEN